METRIETLAITEAAANRKLTRSHSRARVSSPPSPDEDISANSALEIKFKRIREIVAIIPGHQYLNGGFESLDMVSCISPSAQTDHPAVVLFRYHKMDR